MSFTQMNTGLSSLDSAKEACISSPLCKGITLALTDEPEAYFLRDGVYDQGNPSIVSDKDLLTWIKQCDGIKQPTKVVGTQLRQSQQKEKSNADLLSELRDMVVAASGSDEEVVVDDGTGYPFPRDITIPPKKGNGIIYVLYWKETKSGCTWQGLANICATEDNKVLGFEHIPEATTAQMCEVRPCSPTNMHTCKCMRRPLFTVKSVLRTPHRVTVDSGHVEQSIETFRIWGRGPFEWLSKGHVGCLTLP